MNSNLLKSLIAFSLFTLSTTAALAGQHEFLDYKHNPYSPTRGHHYRHGVVPMHDTWKRMRQYQQQFPAATTSTKTLSYGGGVDSIGVTSGTPQVYLVFWGSQWGSSSTDSNGDLVLSNDPVNAAPYLQQFFKGLGTGGELWSGVMTQYCDGSQVTKGATSCPSGAAQVGYPKGGALAGVWYDNSATEPSNATASQLATEAVKAASHFGNTTASSNRYVQYVIISSTGLHPDGFNTPSGMFCAWHTWNGDSSVRVSSSVGDVAFTNLPYVYDAGRGCAVGAVNSGSKGNLDSFSVVEGHEYAETITDQLPPGGWLHGTSSENGDECAYITSGQGAMANVAMGNGSYAMQSTWSNDTNACEMSHAIVGSGVNATPVANSGSVTTTENTPVNGTLSASDTDGDVLGFAIVAQPAHGSVAISNTTTGDFTYTPASGYAGNDAFTFNATDNAGNASNTATESVTVKSATAPSPTPTPTSTPAPTPAPTSTPTPLPSPTPIPTVVPTPFPTPIPTVAPTPFPTPNPTIVPTPFPTWTPTSWPTPFPTWTPTSWPTPFPTWTPTSWPTPYPTWTPTTWPTWSPTSLPTPLPTWSPVTWPTPYPTYVPILLPTPSTTWPVFPARIAGSIVHRYP